MHFLSFRKLLLTGVLCLSAWHLSAQNTLNTTIGSTGYTGTNSSGTNSWITFVIENLSGSDIILTDVGRFTNTTHNGTTSQIWYSTTSLSGPVGSLTSPAWTMISSQTVSGITATTVNPINTGMNFTIPNGATWRFASFTTGTNSYSGTGVGTCTPNSFTLNGVTLRCGDYQIGGQFIGYGATNNPRFFTGSITWVSGTNAPDDAGITEILSPTTFCSGSTVPLTVNVKNFGTEQLDSCMIVWDINGNVSSAWYQVQLDTFGGTGPQDTVITIDSIVGPTGALDITVYTMLPNGVADTVNGNDTASLFLPSPSLSGTYTIGSSMGANFPTFTAAVDVLAAVGVCGPVVFEVESGTYNEQVIIPAISGASSVNTITFESQVMDSSQVTMTFTGTTPTNNYIIVLDGADWIRIQGIGFINNGTLYDHAIDIQNGADSNIITNCYFQGNYNSTSTNAALIFSGSGLDNGNVIKNSHFEGGGFAIYMYGASTTSLESGTVIENNTFLNQYYHTVRCYYQDAPIVRNNFFMSNSTYTVGAALYMLYCDNGMEVSNNHILRDTTSYSGNFPYYGIYFSLNDGQGLFQTSHVFNNRIVIGADTNTTNTSVFYGIYMTSTNAMKLANNTVTILNGGTSARALYQSGSNLTYYQNNLFTTYSSGHAAYYLSGISIEIDHNNYYAPNGTEIYYNGLNYDLPNFQSTGYETNGHNVNPEFIDIFQGYLCNDMLDATATPLAFVPNDATGAVRASTPDPGAVEFIGVNNFSIGNNDTICGSTHTLELSGPIQNVTWSVNGTQSSGNSVTLTAANQPVLNNVGVAFISSIGCGAAADQATFLLVPAADLDSTDHLCAEQTMVLNPGGGNQANYLWTPGNATSSSLTVSEPGTYHVEMEEFGCESEATIEITQSVAVDLVDIEACDFDLPVTVNASVPDGLNYAWDGGANITSAINEFNDAGDYSVTATDAFGCVSEDEFLLTVVGEPTAVITESHSGTIYLFNSGSSFGLGSNPTYTWIFGDGNTSNDPNPAHQYPWSNPGSLASYIVTLEIDNGCYVDMTELTVTPDPVGVEELKNGAIAVYPNPANDMVNIKLPSAVSNGKISVKDLSGRIINEVSVSNSDFVTIDLANLSKGNYFIEVEVEGSRAISQLSVQ